MQEESRLPLDDILIISFIGTAQENYFWFLDAMK